MPRLTLNRVFAGSLIGLLAGLAMVFHGLQSALLRSAEMAQERNAAVIAQSVTDYLEQAPAAAENFEGLLRAGLANPGDTRSVRNGLLSVLLANLHISEATFTFGTSHGFDGRMQLLVDPATVGQVTLFRNPGSEELVERNTRHEGSHFIATVAQLSLDGRESGAEAPIEVENPAEHATFRGPTLSRLYGRLLWTDIHYSAIGTKGPNGQRRVEVSVQKALGSPPGTFVGVLRIGLFKSAIDQAISSPPAVDIKTHSIFLCDNEGRLIALSGSSHYIDSGGDLRLAPETAPPQVRAALRLPVLSSVDEAHPSVSTRFEIGGTTYLCSFGSLPNTQDWIAGLVVPQDAYLAGLLKIRKKVLWGMIALALLGLAVLRAVAVAHSVIVHEAARMNDFIFEPSVNRCRFQDIDRVLSSLERAKTAMRSMGKYVPMDLVRMLYHKGEEPRLGGLTTELSVLFTDIQGFTEFAERTAPDIVALHLGAYLEVLASVIHRERGTIDKFIGDSVMAFWNAPEPVLNHSALACRAALAGREALGELYRSETWEGLPAFETRFGLHRCVASVGHFGAPDRFNYTAIGDGINLASRLEGLNKHYGTNILVSESLKEAAGPGFWFRRLDRVSVKGKTERIDIYELIGVEGAGAPEFRAVYEAALDAWFRGDFRRAIELAESQPEDPPSVFLLKRALRCVDDPPEGEWTGIHAFETK